MALPEVPQYFPRKGFFVGRVGWWWFVLTKIKGLRTEDVILCTACKADVGIVICDSGQYTVNNVT